MVMGKRLLIPLLVVGLMPISVLAEEQFVQAAPRQIEEIIVTAEKRQSTVSDTSIAITAFSQSMIEDFGIQGANELVNFTPATTRDPYDIRIRGVGRNFRALGGDPGIATYYNGVYSEDFGIAASENGLFDVERIEVLRGPQGTLYGRNAIGGALNYISNRPTFDFEAQTQVQVGNMGTTEFNGMVSFPLWQDLLATRITYVNRVRDGSMDGRGTSQDVNSIDDDNFAIAFLATPTDNLTFYARYNDRNSNRTIGTGTLLDEGPVATGSLRGARDTTFFAQGFTAAPAGSGAQFGFTDPADGSLRFANRPRPGIDVAASASPNAAYLNPQAELNNPGNAGRHDTNNLNRINPGNKETFDHNAVSFEATWDVSSNLTLRYIYGYSDFDYTFDLDVDRTNADWTDFRFNVLEDAYTWSHELQVLWGVGKLTGTSGAYLFYSNRRQDFGIHNPLDPRYTQPADYGFLDDAFGLVAIGGFSATNPQACWTCFAFPAVTSGPDEVPSTPDDVTVVPAPLLGSEAQAHKRKSQIDMGTQPLGLWEGDANPGCNGKAFRCDPGSAYDYQNDLRNESFALFTQVEYEFNQNWFLTLGIRYARDEKDAEEDIVLYFEDNADTGFLAGVHGFGPFMHFTAFGLGEPPVAGPLDFFSSFFGLPLAGCEVDPGGFVGGVLGFGGRDPFFTGGCVGPIGTSGLAAPGQEAQTGLTNLAQINVLMGNATLNYNPFDRSTFNPDQPIIPVCDLQDADCAHPLRLQGIPYSLARRTSATESYDAVTWRVNVDWVPNDNTLLYAAATTGYRAGGFSIGIFDTVTLDPVGNLAPSSYEDERVINYELGYKGSLLDRTLQLFVSVYRYEYDDYQDRTDTFDPVRNTTVDTVTNAPEAINMGFELEATWLATDNFTIGGNYSYTDTKYSEDFFLTNFDDPATPPSIFGPPVDFGTGIGLRSTVFPVSGCQNDGGCTHRDAEAISTDPAQLAHADPAVHTAEVLVDPGRTDLYVFNVSGNSLKRIPTHKSVLWGVYTFRTDLGNIALSGTWSYTGEYQATPLDRSFEETPDRQRVDLSIRYTTPNERLTARVFVDNVFDEGNLNDVTTSSQSANYALNGSILYPRFYGMNVSYRFGEG